MSLRISAALGMEDGQPAADLGREVEQVELDARGCGGRALGLLQPVQVLGQRLVGLPRGAVDPLEHRAVLVAPPVGTCHPHELERAEPAGGGHVGAAAQVDEALPGSAPLRYDADLAAAGALVGLDALDDLHLVGLVGETARDPRRVESSSRTKGWSSSTIARMRASMRPRSSVGERGPAGEVEVVVEAVLDRRADGVFGAGEQVADGLGQHVGGGVAEHVAAGVGVGGDDGHLAAVGQRCREVDLGAVDGGRHRRLGQAPTDRLGQVAGCGPRRQGAGRPVGQGDGDLA